MYDVHCKNITVVLKIFTCTVHVHCTLCGNLSCINYGKTKIVEESCSFILVVAKWEAANAGPYAHVYMVGWFVYVTGLDSFFTLSVHSLLVYCTHVFLRVCITVALAQGNPGPPYLSQCISCIVHVFREYPFCST